RAGARAARGGRSDDGRRRRRLAGRRGRGRGLRARRARARRLRVTRPVHARRSGAGAVRAPPARPHPPLHARPAAPGDRAGHGGGLHAIPVAVAARRTGRPGRGPEGLGAVLELLDGYEVPAGAWEADVLPARLGEYDPLWLDGLCLSGEIAWGRLSPAASSNGHKSGPIRKTAIALFRSERGEVWGFLTVNADP